MEHCVIVEDVADPQVDTAAEGVLCLTNCWGAFGHCCSHCAGSEEIMRMDHEEQIRKFEEREATLRQLMGCIRALSPVVYDDAEHVAFNSAATGGHPTSSTQCSSFLYRGAFWAAP
jgi:hypothetical protein